MTFVSTEDGTTVASSALPGDAPPKPRWRRRLAPILSVAVGTLPIGLHATWYGHWLIDDAAITFAYARSFSEGLGPVIQAGADPVEGFSSPVWLALLALGRLMGLFDHGMLFGIPDYVLFPKALALLCCAGLLTVCYLAARKVTPHPWLPTVLIGIVLAAIPSFVIWSFSGLENPLYALIVTGLAVLLFHAVLAGRLHSARIALIAGGLAALAALTRPEGLVYAGAYPLVVLGNLRRATVWSGVRSMLLSLTVFLVPIGAYFGWRYFTFGRWVSSPSVAKRQGLPTLSDMARPGELVHYVGAPAVLLLVAVVGMLLATAPWWRRGLLSLLVPLGLALFAYAVLEPDWMDQYRFATSVWALGALIGALAVTEMVRQSSRRGRAWLAAGLVAALLPTLSTSTSYATDFRTDPNISACYVADRFGRVFNAYADILGVDNASLLLPDLGGSALTSRLTLIDMAGLTHNRFADLARARDRAGQSDYVYDEVYPTFIHIRQPWSSGTGIGDDPRLVRDYHSIHFDIYQGAPYGDWVRKDAVPGAETLNRLRAYARTVTTRIEQDVATQPRNHCGPTMYPGQTPADPP